MKKVSSKKSIRVLQIGMHDRLGGVEVFLMNYYKNINKDNIQFDFVNHCDTLYFSDAIQSMGGKIYNVTNFKKNPISYYLQIKNIIKENNYEIIHINLLSCANILPVIAAKRCGVKNIIVHSHNNGMPHNILKIILHNINKKIVTKLANVLWACSKSAGQWMFGNNKFEVIKNGIDVDKFAYNEKNREMIRKKFNISDDKYIIGNIGRFDIQKNHEFLIEVFYDISKKFNDVILMLIGEGTLYKDIEKKVKNLNLENRVIFVGVVNDPEKYYSAMDMFMLPSRFEGLGIVNVEAQVSNLPCIVSNAVPREVKLIDIFKFESLENKNKWIEDFSKLRELHKNRMIINKNIEQYDIKKLAIELENYYKNM